MKMFLNICMLLAVVLQAGCDADLEPLPSRALAAPQIYPETNVVNAGSEIVIYNSYSGSQLRYTTDGTLPGPANGLDYIDSSRPVVQSNSGTLRFRARYLQSGFLDSPPAERVYLVNPAAVPLFSPAKSAGYYSSTEPLTVSITTATPDAVIRYSIDGSDPGAGGGILYTGPLLITNSLRLRAAAFHSNLAASPVVYQDYQISGTVPLPVLLPGGGVYGVDDEIFEVSVSNLDFGGGVAVYYTTNGSDPRDTNSSTLLPAGFPGNYISLIAGYSYQLRTVALDTNSGQFSPVVDAQYSFRSARPQLASTATQPGTYHVAPLQIEFTATSPYPNFQFGTWYTTNGNVPVPQAAGCYKFTNGTPLQLSNNVTILAINTNTNRQSNMGFTRLLPNSSVLTLQYRLQSVPPQFDPPGGTFDGDVILRLEHTNTTGSNLFEIYYTTDGSDPRQYGMQYTGQFLLTQDALVKACVKRAGWSDSDVVSVWYGFDYNSGGGSSSSDTTGSPPLFISAFAFGAYNNYEHYYFGSPYGDRTLSWVDITVADLDQLQTHSAWGLYAADSAGAAHLIQAGSNWDWGFAGLTNGAVIRVTLHDGTGYWNDPDGTLASPDRFDYYVPAGNLLDRSYGVLYLESGGTALHGIPYRFTASAGTSWYDSSQQAYTVLQQLTDRGMWTGADTPYDIHVQYPSNALVLAKVSYPGTGNDWMSVILTAQTGTKTPPASAATFTYGEFPADVPDNIALSWEKVTNLASGQTVDLTGDSVDGVVTAIFTYEEGVSPGCFALQDASGAMLFYGTTNVIGFSVGDRVTVSLSRGVRLDGCPFVDQYSVSGVSPGGNPDLYYRSGAFWFPQAIGRLWRYDGTVSGSFDGSGSAPLDSWIHWLHTDSSNHAALPSGKSGTFFGVVTYRNGQYRLTVPTLNDYTVLSP